MGLHYSRFSTTMKLMMLGGTRQGNSFENLLVLFAVFLPGASKCRTNVRNFMVRVEASLHLKMCLYTNFT